MTLSMWWRRFDIDAVDESQILRSLVVTTRRLFIWVVYFTSSIFSSLTDIDMSLVFFVDWLWLLEEMLSRRWKLCTMTFLITQRSNIVRTASNWDLLTLLTSIRTQNRIKRFIVDITYRWISLPVSEASLKKNFQDQDNHTWIGVNSQAIQKNTTISGSTSSPCIFLIYLAIRGDALKYWKWPSYSLKGQRSLLYKHLYLSYIYLIIILFPISLCQLKNAVVRSVQPLEQLLPTLDIRIDHLYASYRLAPKFLWHQYQISAIMLANRLKFMEQSLFAGKTLLLNRVLEGLHCYARSKLI